MPDIQTTATADTDDPIRNIEKQISELQSLPRDRHFGTDDASPSDSVSGAGRPGARAAGAGPSRRQRVREAGALDK